MNEGEFISVKKKSQDDFSVIDVNGHKIGGNTFTIFAGPCRIESEKQITQTALAVKKAGAHILKMAEKIFPDWWKEHI